MLVTWCLWIHILPVILWNWIDLNYCFYFFDQKTPELETTNNDFFSHLKLNAFLEYFRSKNLFNQMKTKLGLLGLSCYMRKLVHSPCRCEKQLKPIFGLNHQVGYMNPTFLDVELNVVCVYRSARNQLFSERGKNMRTHYTCSVYIVYIWCACCMSVSHCVAYSHRYIQFIHDNEIQKVYSSLVSISRWVFRTVVDNLQCTWHIHTQKMDVRVQEEKSDCKRRVKKYMRHQIKSTMQISFFFFFFFFPLDFISGEKSENEFSKALKAIYDLENWIYSFMIQQCLSEW